jgi:hypothetical protein
MSWGAANIQNLAPSTDELAVLRIIWCSSVVHVIYLALVFLSLSVVFTVSMEWLNVKRIRVQRREAVESSD